MSLICDHTEGKEGPLHTAIKQEGTLTYSNQALTYSNQAGQTEPAQ